MAEIRNLTRNGETFYPLTTLSAVINESTEEGMVIDDIPVARSNNLVKSGGIIDYTEENFIRQEQSLGGGDLDISDDNYNTIARFKNGHIKTKEFDSETIIRKGDADCDFSISDESGNEVFRVKNGYPQTKNFNGEKIGNISSLWSLAGNSNIPKTQAVFSAGSTITLSDVPENIKNGSCINFGCTIPADSAWTSLVIGKKSNTYGGIWYEITSSSIIVHYREGAVGTERVYTTYTHGLTFDTYIKLFIQFKVDTTARIEIETFNGHYSNNNAFCFGFNTYGAPFVNVNGGNLTNITFSYSSDKYKKPLWIFGDSYFGTIETRVLYYLIEWGICEDILVNALPGVESSGSYIDLLKSKKYGCPKTIVWMLGMNGTNSLTISSIQSLKIYCESNNIELIINDVPTTTLINNETLHNYVQSSGIRYVHSYDAVGSSPSGNWYSGYLDNDNVHPTSLGARAIAMQMLIDVPELMQFVTDRGN